MNYNDDFDSILRERQLNRSKDIIRRKMQDNVSCKKIYRNDSEESQKLLILDGTTQNVKSFTTLPYDECFLGDLIKYSSLNWLVTDANYEYEFYVRGTLTRCNYELKWQNKDKQILSTPVVVNFNTKTTEDDKTIIIGGNKVSIEAQLTDETKQFTRGQRFFVDNSNPPIPYEVKSIDNITNVINGNGYLTLILEESQIKTTDNLELMICDYEEEKETSQTTVTINTNSDYLFANYKNGFRATCTFLDENDLEIADIEPEWIVNCLFMDDLQIITDGNKIQLLLFSENYYGQSISITVQDKNNSEVKATKIIEVAALG